MKPVVVYFMKGKLSPIDTHLPLMMELLASGLVAEVNIFCSDPDFGNLLQDQWLLASALDKFSINLFIKPRASVLKSRLQFYIDCLWKLKLVLFRKVWFFGLKDTPRHYKFLAKFNRAKLGGLSIGTFLDPRNEETYKWFMEGTAKTLGRIQGEIRLSDLDLILTSRETLDPNIVVSKTTRILSIGYVRGFPVWAKFIEQHSKEDLGEALQEDYCFWPLSVLKREERGLSINLEEQLIDTLNIFYDINYPLRVVFRLHPTTDAVELGAILARSRFKRFIFSSAHPSSLIANARFIFSNTGSTLFCDASYAGCPVVQYSSLRYSFTVNDELGWPLASLYQPIVDHFATNRDDFVKILWQLSTPTMDGDPVGARVRQGKAVAPNATKLLQKLVAATS